MGSISNVLVSGFDSMCIFLPFLKWFAVYCCLVLGTAVALLFIPFVLFCPSFFLFSYVCSKNSLGLFISPWNTRASNNYTLFYRYYAQLLRDMYFSFALIFPSSTSFIRTNISCGRSQHTNTLSGLLFFFYLNSIFFRFK